ncbi:MAG: tRNA-specific 2-thiouridylase MnmA [Parcubacteria group bacterium GW2011_GWA2_47_7]|nr:MAG: tRNA-specific 2-thiouridylase MnmA [Parcubacteria group bacterium GW2011_GWA2_47_7]
MIKKKGKIFVGLSGGVDSSVSAALLKEQGYDVVGVFIKVWQADFLPCTWREERRDAMRAAAHLGIPFLTLDLEKEYKQEVVDYMIREYREGRVPNPDVMCNKHVKFGAFLDFAKKNYADAIATGHYARAERDDTDMYRLHKGVDQEKDQSYFLWTLTQDQLAHTLFPIGHFEKSEVRKLAKQFGLPNAEKKDSQGLCFMGAVDMKDFLKHCIKTSPGSVLDVHGNIIGTHEGAMLYTIGQRHGFHSKKKRTNELPLFVTSKNIEKNTVTVGPATEVNTLSAETQFNLCDTNWIPPNRQMGEKHLSYQARIRYRGVLYGAIIHARESTGGIRVTLNTNNEFIAPGQSMVFYDEDECVGGGIIAEL